MAGVKRKVSPNADIFAIQNEWEEILCPICMDHPHNAVLLRCTSHENGCKSYICDTSYRHSNCLDRFKELKAGSRSNHSVASSLAMNSDSSSNPSNADVSIVDESHNINESSVVRGSGENAIQIPNRNLEIQEGILEPGDSESSWERIDIEEYNLGNASESKLSLNCPMCRGAVLSWEIAEEARKYLNLMRRSCSQELCSFFGNYQELRRHARRVHPTARPADIDPSRERSWRHLERQREFDDVVSAVRSAMPGAVVFGDYVIESGDRLSGERENGTGEVNGPLWSTFFLFQMFGSADPIADPRGPSRHRHLARDLSGRRRFRWGENLLGLQDDNQNDEEGELNILSDVGEHAPQIVRRRQSLTRSRFDGSQSGLRDFYGRSDD